MGESRGISDEGSDAPLSLLTFWNVWKADEKILEEFENFDDVRFVELKCAVEGDMVVLAYCDIDNIVVGVAVVPAVDHFLLMTKESKIVEGDP
jgi:hypothetical protein